MTLLGVVDALTDGEKARHPESLAVVAYFDGWNQAVGHSPITFPRFLTRDEEREWRLGWADGRRHGPLDDPDPDDVPEREPEPHLEVAQIHPADTTGPMPDWFMAADADALAPYPPVDGSQPCAQTDPEAWFPDKGGSNREAKRMCHSCRFEEACGEYALANPDLTGVWGGMSEKERKQIIRARQVAAA